MIELVPPRIETGPAMLLAGVRRSHAFAGAADTIPAQWRDLAARLPLPGQRGSVTYGAVCGSDPAAGTLEYLAGVQVDGFEALPPEIGRMRVPEQRYAVFIHRDGAAALRAAWDAIWQRWLPASGWRPADSPDFERYDPARFDPATGRGEIEIWFPVAGPGQDAWDLGAPSGPP